METTFKIRDITTFEDIKNIIDFFKEDSSIVEYYCEPFTLSKFISEYPVEDTIQFIHDILSKAINKVREIKVSIQAEPTTNNSLPFSIYIVEIST